MKTLSKFLVAMVVTLGIVAFTTTKKEKSSEYEIKQVKRIVFTKEVRRIIDTKCMGCHNPESRNKKGKEKLQWIEVAKMKDKKEMKSFLGDLYEVLEAGEMPPAKALKRRPQMKLTDAETKTLLDWVEKQEKRIR